MGRGGISWLIMGNNKWEVYLLSQQIDCTVQEQKDGEKQLTMCWQNLL